MIDPVSEELERRGHLELRWRWAVAGAVSIHLAVVLLLLVTQSHGRRALTLPRVQVRIATAVTPGAQAASRQTAAPQPAAKPAVESAKKPKVRKAVEPPPRHPIPDKQAPRQAKAAPAPPSEPAETTQGTPGGAGEVITSAKGGLAVGVGNGGGEETFPFTYYLNRVLGLIEGNWFRPPTAQGTSCRVRCVIDRSGRLVEAGLESESQTPAFDRAALRAVYASAPFPPLPQSFGGSTLTLHLEFGP